MIIGQNFVWMHFPKCAGIELEKILRDNFENDRSIHFDTAELGYPEMHDSLQARILRDPTFSFENKIVICNIRRLPGWMLSRVHQEKQRRLDFVLPREEFLKGFFLEQDKIMNKADKMAESFSFSAGKSVDRWIRTENFAEDFVNAFSDIIDISNINIEKAQEYRNKGKFDYIRDIEFYFTPAELRYLYENNPIWADLEMSIYGDIIELKEDVNEETGEQGEDWGFYLNSRRLHQGFEILESQNDAIKSILGEQRRITTKLNRLEQQLIHPRSLFKKVKLRLRSNRHIKIVKMSGLFDTEWYLKTYPDVAESGVDPRRHYVDHGWWEGRNPSPDFDTDDYLTKRPDVAAAGICPLVHYILFGREEEPSSDK